MDRFVTSVLVFLVLCNIGEIPNIVFEAKFVDFLGGFFDVERLWSS